MASRYFSWVSGEVHYTRLGWGDPLLLVHNVYPGASHDEFEHNVNELSQHYTVYAIDLLGFGDSDAPRMKYTAAMYVRLLQDFVEQEIGQRTHVMAAGLSCAYVSEMAVCRPDLVDRLVFVCPRSEPTGLDSPRWIAPLQRVFLTTPLGGGVYETLATRYELTTYLHNNFADPRHVTPDQIERLHVQANRENSILAYASLLTGFLDCNIFKSLPHLSNPILLLWGRNARPTPVEHSVRLTSLARDCDLKILENAGAWVHHECSAKVNTLVNQFLTPSHARQWKATSDER